MDCRRRPSKYACWALRMRGLALGPAHGWLAHTARGRHQARAHQVAAARRTGDTVSMSNLSQSTLETLAREYGLEVDAVDAHAESVQEGESGAERGAHLQRLQEQHGWTAERATQFLQALEAARGAAH